MFGELLNHSHSVDAFSVEAVRLNGVFFFIIATGTSHRSYITKIAVKNTLKYFQNATSN